MKGSNLGEFQELVLLTIMVLGDNAYGVTIQREVLDRTGRKITMGALHSALIRLGEKSFITSQMSEATNIRGGRRKRIYSISELGKQALREANFTRQQYYKSLPELDLGFNTK